MKTLATVVGIGLFLGVTTNGAWAQGCDYLHNRVVERGRDDNGYFIRATVPTGWHSIEMDSPTAELAHYFASEAGAVVYNLTSGTAKYLGGGEWRGADPLSTLRAFAEAAGLKVAVPQEGLWVIGYPELIGKFALTVFAYPIDPGQARRLSENDATVLERQIIRTLPVLAHATARPDGMIRDEIGYYWVPEERDTLIVTMYGGRGAVRPNGPFGVFKVKVNEAAGRLGLECQWANWGPGDSGPEGRLLFGINEDFDGDGYRDFVFLSDDTNLFPNTIVSGKDGHNLGTYSDLSLAVEKRSSGPRRFAGTASVPATGPFVFSQSLGVAVAEYSKESGKFLVPEVEALKGNASAMGAHANQTDPPQLLARVVGGRQNVRVYALPVEGTSNVSPGYANSYRKQGFEVILVPPGNWPLEVMDSQLKAGFPAHFLLTYKSPGYLAEEAREQEQQRIHR